jgi:hypothetical protein
MSSYSSPGCRSLRRNTRTPTATPMTRSRHMTCSFLQPSAKALYALYGPSP